MFVTPGIVKAKMNSATAKTHEFRAAQASHASLADRVGYMEQRMGDSFAKHAQATGVDQPWVPS